MQQPNQVDTPGKRRTATSRTLSAAPDRGETLNAARDAQHVAVQACTGHGEAPVGDGLALDVVWVIGKQPARRLKAALLDQDIDEGRDRQPASFCGHAL